MREAQSPTNDAATGCPRIYGHRGAAGLKPENTLPSFRAAIAHQVDGIELDVHFAHNQLWVIHDERLDRTTDGRGLIADQTEARLQRLDAGGAPIPTLPEVLDLLPPTLEINIELKGPGTAEPVLALTGATPDRPLLLSSFNHEELASYRAAGGRAPVGVLSERWQPTLLKTASQLAARSINLPWRAVTAPRVRTIHQAGFEVLVYTVNRLPTARRLTRCGVDGLFTDRPDRISRAALAC